MKTTIKQYAQTLFELTDGKSEQEISAMVKKFAEQLKKDGQIKNAKRIMEKFAEIYNEKNGIVVAEITTKEKIGKDAIGNVEKFIKERYSAKEVVIENNIDEKIQGGIIIRVGDEILDASVSAQLRKLQNILSK